MSSNRLTQKLVHQWLHEAWRDGFTKGVDGRDEIPDFHLLDPRKKNQVPKPDPQELSQDPFDPLRCNARVWNSGWGKQCNCKKIDGNDLCKSHQEKFKSLGQGLDLGLGRYDQPRPSHSLDKLPEDPQYKQHNWADIRKTGKSPNRKKKVPAKLMREQLTELGVSIDGLKGRALTDRYNQVMEEQSISSVRDQSPVSSPQTPEEPPQDFEPEPEPEPVTQSVTEPEPEHEHVNKNQHEDEA